MTPPGRKADPLFEDVDLAIFDFDGVIADSEVISLASLGEALRAYGMDFTTTQVRTRYLGASLDKIMAEVAAQSPKRTSEGFRDFWHAILFERFRAELTPVPGLLDLLDRLDERGTPFCIASSGSFERIGVALETMGLAPRFEHVFSAELVEHGKPAPDLFLHAAERVGIRPGACLVIEDSPFGIRAAKAAGMRAVGFLGGAHLRGIEGAHGQSLLDVGADRVVVSLGDVLPGSTDGSTGQEETST